MGNLENVRILCSGFEASAAIKENIMIVFRNLLDEVPYDAFLEVSLSKVDSGFEGRIEVSSIAGEFVSAQADMTPQDLVEKLAADLRLQLTDWKSKRFFTAAREIQA